MTGLLPDPTVRTKMVDYDCLTGKIPIPVLETECRKEHIDMIDQGHPLLPVALRCLAMKEEGRSSARELCELLEEVKLTLVDAITAPDYCQVSDPVEATKLKTGEKACRCEELEAIRQDQEHKVSSLHRQLQISEATIAELNSIKQNQEKKIESLLQQLKERSSSEDCEESLSTMSLYLLWLIISTREINFLYSYELTGNHIATIKDGPIFERASAIFCGDMLYLAEIESKGKWTKEIIRTSLSKLFHKQSFLGFKTATTVEWEKMAPLPVVRSTCVSYRNHLLSVGGYEEEGACNKIFAYDEAQSSWDIIGYIPTARYNCLVNVVRDQLVVVGGWINHMECCDIVEIGTLHIYN